MKKSTDQKENGVTSERGSEDVTRKRYRVGD